MQVLYVFGSGLIRFGFYLGLSCFFVYVLFGFDVGFYLDFVWVVFCFLFGFPSGFIWVWVLCGFYVASRWV